MPTQRVIRSAKGLYLHQNPLGEDIPEGGLLEADNVSIDREGVISKRRGFNRYGVTFSPSVIFEYEDQLMGLESTTLKRDVNGNGSEWRALDGTYSPPDSETRMRSVQGLKSLYFTTSLGLYKLDDIASVPFSAGVPTGLDIELSLAGDGNDWFNPDTSVAYRVVWGRIDANDVLLLGAPSFREVITNPYTGPWAWARSGGGPYTITVTHTAHGFAPSDKLEIVETDSTDENRDPDSSLTTQFTIVATPTVDTYTFSTSTDPGAGGYLVDAKKANVLLEFPIPADIREGDFYEIHRTELSPDLDTPPDERFLKVVRVAVADTDIATGTITITDDKDPDFLGEDLYTNPGFETILQQNSRPPWARDLAHFRNHLFLADTEQREILDLQMIDINGLVLDSSSLTLTLGGTQLTYTFSASENVATRKVKVYSGEPTLALAIRETMKSLVRVINRDTGNDLWDAYYISGINDPPGIVGIQCRALNTGEFSLTSNSLANTGSKFTPTIPISGTLYSSDNDRQVARLYYSKFDQHEAVPESNFFDIGDATKRIVRILPTRDALFILKEDGVWRLSGDTDQDFTVRQVDPTQRILIQESAVVLDNSVWCFTADGIVRITEAGTTLISRPIESELLKIPTFPNYETITHAVGYQSEGKYILWAQSNEDDATVTCAWVFNTLTKAWTKWLKEVKAAWIHFDSDTLYLSHANDAQVLTERKSLDEEGSDFQDEDIPIEFDNIGTSLDENGNQVTTVDVLFTYAVPQPGWLLENNPVTIERAEIIEVTTIASDQYRLTLDTYFPGLVAGDGVLVLAIPMRARWLPEDADNVGLMKQFSWVQIYLEQGVASRHRLGFSSDLTTTETIVDVTIPETTRGQVINMPVPRGYQRCRELSLAYLHRVAKQDVQVLQATYDVRPYSSRTSMVPR